MALWNRPFSASLSPCVGTPPMAGLPHDDVIKWKHFPRYWPFVRGIHRSPGNSPHKGQWRGALMISLICVWINGWVYNREAGDLRRYRAHYDVTVMQTQRASNTEVLRFFVSAYKFSNKSLSGLCSETPYRPRDVKPYGYKTGRLCDHHQTWLIVYFIFLVLINFISIILYVLFIQIVSADNIVSLPWSFYST